MAMRVMSCILSSWFKECMFKFIESFVHFCVLENLWNRKTDKVSLTVFSFFGHQSEITLTVWIFFFITLQLCLCVFKVISSTPVVGQCHTFLYFNWFPFEVTGPELVQMNKQLPYHQLVLFCPSPVSFLPSSKWLKKERGNISDTKFVMTAYKLYICHVSGRNTLSWRAQ